MLVVLHFFSSPCIACCPSDESRAILQRGSCIVWYGVYIPFIDSEIRLRLRSTSTTLTLTCW